MDNALPPGAVGDLANPLSASYDLGSTAMFACKADPRFHYCLYVPPEVRDGEQVDLLVAVHGSSRDSFLEFRNGFARSFRDAGVNVQLDLMAGVSHERLKMLPQVQDFLVRHQGTK